MACHCAGSRKTVRLESVETPILVPWLEVVGAIEKVENNTIILACRQMTKIDCTEKTIRKYRRLLKSGNAIGILATDHEIRIRLIK